MGARLPDNHPHMQVNATQRRIKGGRNPFEYGSDGRDTTTLPCELQPLLTFLLDLVDGGDGGDEYGMMMRRAVPWGLYDDHSKRMLVGIQTDK